MNIAAIILAAGASSRFLQAGYTEKKQFLRWKGVPLFWHSARCFARIPCLSNLFFVFPPADLGYWQDQVQQLDAPEPLHIPWKCVGGGQTRQQSVYNAITALPPDTGIVLVHDGARPFLQARLVTRLIEALHDVDGVVPGLPVTDTIKEVRSGLVRQTPDRQTLWSVQTPQAFFCSSLLAAHEQAKAQNRQGTDDASLVEQMGGKIKVIAGDPNNQKITTPEDIDLLSSSSSTPLPCIGYGYDVHQFGGNRPLVLGGIPIAGSLSVRAHSDGDVVLHALADALLACLGQGDIGELFPDNDIRFENASSAVFISEIMELVQRYRLSLCHIDITIITQVPKIAPHKKSIRLNIARLLHCEPANINIKATTEEGLGFTGKKQGIKAVAVVTALKPIQRDNER